MTSRSLSGAERAIAGPVFKNSLPWSRIRIADDLGLGDRPYTWARVLHVGAAHFQGMDTSLLGASLLVHELTHVWQHEHRDHAASYILDSMSAQVAHGQTAYKYTVGKAWASYNAEQQASIVEHWFLHGRSTKSPLFPYVRDHIWKKSAASSKRHAEYPDTF